MTVDDDVAARARAALATLADLTPAAARRNESLSIPLEWFQWMDEGFGLMNDGPTVDGHTVSSDAPAALEVYRQVTPIDRALAERLAALQQVRVGRHPIRLGWLWLAGTTTVVAESGERSRKRVFLPLVSRRVRVQRAGRLLGWEVESYGDVDITPLVEDAEVARRLEGTVEFGGGAFTHQRQITPEFLAALPRLNAFIRDAAAAAGFTGAPTVIDRREPDDLMRDTTVQVVVGLGIYAVDDPERTTRAGSLLAWPDAGLRTATAFHAVYAASPTDAGAAVDESPVESPLPLTQRQTEVVRPARTSALTVVSGAPGTGKSHTLVAIVCDALSRGESILVAAKNDAAVDALADILDRQPGVTPILFGASERRSELARRLADGEPRTAVPAELAASEQHLAAAVAARDAARDVVRRSLAAAWMQSSAGTAALSSARSMAPRAFDGHVAGLDAALVAAVAPATGWWSRRRRRRAERRLAALVAAPAGSAADEVIAAVRLAETWLVAPDAPTPADACAALVDAQDAACRALAAWLSQETRSPDRLDRGGRATIAALATALRSGRSARRVQLERLGDRTLTRALPLWMGTLGDVDDLLPPVSALFDLVLIDEASAAEQTLAASTLLRGRRAVVVGDPRQLRHISFLSDETVSQAMDAHAVEPAARAQLDVRRNSVFDAAAASGAVVMLDEHFRSVPHLIDVVARTLYDGRLLVATRTPLTDSIDSVHLEATTGSRSGEGLVQAEIDAVLAELRRLASTATSVGVLTPFRAQADALEAAILAAFTADDLIRMDVRVGTVHAFQGNERDAVLCSLGLVDGDRSGWSFVADSHLLAVMLTRARLSMTVVASCTPEPTTVLGAYVAAADSPPGPPAPVAALAGWARSVADDMRLAGLVVHEAYPTGRHVVDIALAARGTATAVMCDLHPDGVEAHIDRHVSLIRAGWTVIDALSASWGDDAPAHTVDLIRSLASPAGTRDE